MWGLSISYLSNHSVWSDLFQFIMFGFKAISKFSSMKMIYQTNPNGLNGLYKSKQIDQGARSFYSLHKITTNFADKLIENGWISAKHNREQLFREEYSREQLFFKRPMTNPTYEKFEVMKGQFMDLIQGSIVCGIIIELIRHVIK